MSPRIALQLSAEPKSGSGSETATHPRETALTPRETQVLGLSAQGKTAAQSGEILGITKRTVNAHMQSIIIKLGAANSVQAVAIGMRDGMITLC